MLLIYIMIVPRVTIGSLTITLPALVTFCVGILALIIFIVRFRSKLSHILAYCAISAIILLVDTYTINCIVTGQCNILAYVLMFSYLFTTVWMIYSVVTTIKTSKTSKKSVGKSKTIVEKMTESKPKSNKSKKSKKSKKSNK
jgi:hypothetical protein